MVLSYSRTTLLSFRNWWKTITSVAVQSSANKAVRLDAPKPINSSTWDSFKTAGILRSVRGRRAGLIKQNPSCLKRDFRQTIGSNNIDKFCHKIHNIPTRVTHERIVHKFTSNAQNTNNLLVIPLTKSSHSSKLGPRVRLASWNAHSIKNKLTSLCDLVISKHLDILAVTETWLTPHDDHCIADLLNTLRDYTLFHVPRISSKGGGVAIIVRKGFAVKQNNDDKHFRAFEHIDLTISLGSNSFRLLTIYRPPPSAKNKLTTAMFLREFSSLTEELIIVPNKLILIGDFNLHIDDVTNRDASLFLDLLESSRLKQHINGPTHIHGHTLDLVITHSDDNLLTSTKTLTELLSDHSVISCTIDFPRPQISRTSIKSRKTQDIDLKSLQQDILNSSLTVRNDSSLNTVTVNYHNTLKDLFDKHAPECTRTMYLRSHAPWYSSELRKAKQEKRRYERKYLHTRLTVDKQIYKDKCDIYNNLLDSSKTNYYKEKVQRYDQKHLFKFIDNLLKVKKSPVLPKQFESLQSLTNRFAQFFNSKIANLRSELSNNVPSSLTVDIMEHCASSFTEFKTVSTETTRRVVMSAPPKTCALDPLPTSIVKDCINVLLPPINNIINLSLSQGVFPSTCKKSMIRPIIKKQSLNPEDLANYRPISNLSFISKVLEKSVANQINSYLSENNLYAKMQSAYKKYHSTETAILRVANDIAQAIDQHQEVILVLLDLSAAFDTIDHDILLRRLHDRFGFSGTVLKWIKSYLDNREQTVAIQEIHSDPISFACGVPQGSVLGPLLFSLYISPMEDIVSAHGLKSVMFADDSQLYLMVKPQHQDVAVGKIELCLKDIKSWNTQNMLKCNPDKTEIMHFKSQFAKSTTPLPAISFDQNELKPTETVRDLGVILDSHLTFKPQVNNVCRSASLAIRNIGKIRKYLDKDSTEKLVHAFISSKLDYCNSVLYGLPNYEIQKLQRLQNSAARLVVRAKRREHITPILRDLHWLPIDKRITFKLLLMTYKALNGLAPVYIKELLQVNNPVRTLRSNNSTTLLVPRSNMASYGDRSFAVSAPKLWNNLPKEIKNCKSLQSFKSLTKTYLFPKLE